MTKGDFGDFRDALRAFESGWDRERYDQGIILDSELDQWAGGPVTDFFPHYTSWGDLTEAEWDAMSYRSLNSLGFVGYQFGEALLIDLGYYQDDFYYLGGDSKNHWDGTWTGKGGIDSLDEFMTAEAQEIAILEAFGHNLKIIETQLALSGYKLNDYLGQTMTYTDVDGSQVTVTLSLTGLLAAAHLRGAYGTLNLLLGNTASTDEYGTSILKYIAEYSGYDAPRSDDLIAFWDNRETTTLQLAMIDEVSHDAFEDVVTDPRYLYVNSEVSSASASYSDPVMRSDDATVIHSMVEADYLM